MASYQTFTTTRIAPPDFVALTAAVRTACGDALAGVSTNWTSYTVKKATPWQPAELTATQTAIDTAPALTPQRQAQNEIDQWPLALKALVLALIDQLNVIRAALPIPLPAITPAQALAAVRQKAGTL